MTEHDQSLFIRCTADDIARLEALAERFSIGTKSGLARLAIRIGMEAIEADPTILLGQPVAKRGGARAGAGRKKAKPKRARK